ncbi:Leukocyte receptor cluster member 9 [Paramuricea clavata]|uniref:Leukocyte receptor cluster member 9 n=1 Tax=Paramuricea clavata TaxID=317549 RepID=A0A6S7IR23_PARCT|nr:Leukocyte receptor cluster member 9 [Paramuricea clavata]
MASVDCNSEQSASADISSDGHIPHVKSSFGFTVYYEMSDNASDKLSEVIVINDKSNERLDFLEECLTKRKLDLSQGDFAESLLKEAEKIFEHGDDTSILEGLDGTNIEKSEEMGATICQYFLKGKCRFGDTCFNVHDKLSTEDTIEDESTNTFENKTNNIKNKLQKPKTNIVESEKSRKKPPMKTATDVINRIQWDEKLNPEHFTVGYLDRFLGIVENSFNSFDWEDVTSVDPTILAIPKHRIQYFKYCDEIVWDKNKRLDCVFGSTGSGMTIVDVIENSQQKQETSSDTQNVNS